MPAADTGNIIREHLELILFFGCLAIVTFWIAWSKGFFYLKKKPTLSKQLSFKTVLIVFAIYLGVSFVIAPLLSRLLHSNAHFSEKAAFATVAWVQFLTLLLILLLLGLFCLTYDKTEVKRIWKDRSYFPPSSILYDIRFGARTWLVGFPFVVVIGQICDLLLFILFGYENYEQVAVRYLKMALNFPSLLPFALFTILVAAPLLEEFLFRGILQTWFRQRLGQKAAIALASLCFALFHLAPSQGLGNISLAVSLFAFACFLGFIYERQGSLFAPISLHMSFNAISAFRILFIPEG